ncbi:type II toxin-antitoxin system RelE/ParE family toxin [Actinacidiphila alni]|uniref:type II toxin-antitoxin system RelE family toxin n=1 Tax=Actinacidiphila alni TaxID=380248 RepID=UPI0033D5C3E3
MTYEIFWDPSATNSAARFLADDPDGLRQVMDAIDLLAEEPRPEAASKWGSPDRLRIHVGRYRVLYEVTDATVTIVVVHLGRVA